MKACLFPIVSGRAVFRTCGEPASWVSYYVEGGWNRHYRCDEHRPDGGGFFRIERMPESPPDPALTAPFDLEEPQPTVTYGSLFTGVGLLDLGVEAAFADVGTPLECAFQAEIDPFCRQVLEKHWPDVPRFEDVRTVANDAPLIDAIDDPLAPFDLGEEVPRKLPDVDVLVGGFP